MKNLLTKGILVALFLSTSLSNAQEFASFFKHITTSGNTQSHVTHLDHKTTNGDRDKLVFITHDFGTNGPYVPQALGVWYNGSKWTIYSQNKEAMQMNAAFNVLVTDKSKNAFIHTNKGSNRIYTKLDHPVLNNNPKAKFIVTQNYGATGPYNPNHISIAYLENAWYIYNLSEEIMPQGAKFNILISSKIFRHTNEQVANNWSFINSTKTNNKRNAMVFATINTYRNNIGGPDGATGVWYSNNKWTVYDESRTKLFNNQSYNVLSIELADEAKWVKL